MSTELSGQYMGLADFVAFCHRGLEKKIAGEGFAACASTKLYLVPKSHNSSAPNSFTVRLARLDRNPESLNFFDSLLER
jgi:hypothetical protein